MNKNIQNQVFSLLQFEKKLSVRNRIVLSSVSTTCNQVIDKDQLQSDKLRLTDIRRKAIKNIRLHPLVRLNVLNKYAKMNPIIPEINIGFILVKAKFPSFIHFYDVPRNIRRTLNVNPERDFPHPMDKFTRADHILWQSFYRLCNEYTKGNNDIDPLDVYNEYYKMREDKLYSLGW